jgi:hypothetical protein
LGDTQNIALRDVLDLLRAYDEDQEMLEKIMLIEQRMPAHGAGG